MPVLEWLEQTVDVPMPQPVASVVEVVPIIFQERILERPQI